MDIRKLQRVIVDALEDVKAHDIVVFNTAHLSDMFDRVIVASGTSNRDVELETLWNRAPRWSRTASASSLRPLRQS